MDNIPNIIISNSNIDKPFFDDFIQDFSSITKYIWVCYADFLQFEKAFELKWKDKKFRLWIHLDSMTQQNKELYAGTRTHKQILRSDSLKHLKYQFISRKYLEKEIYGIPVREAGACFEDYIKENPQNNPVLKNLLHTDKITTGQKEALIKKRYDYVLISALYFDEFEQIKNVFNIDTENSEKINIGKHVGYSFKLHDKTILITFQSEMGMVDSSILTTKIILNYSPKYIIMPGVCAGDTDTNFGDIVLSSKIHLTQAGKLSEEIFKKEIVVSKIDPQIVNIIKSENKKLLTDVQVLFTKDELAKERFSSFNVNTLKFHAKPTACSTMVIDKKDYFKTVQKDFERKIVAVEMEGYGVARACELVNEGKTKAIILKSVMDHAEDKDDNAKRYAAYISATFVKSLLTNGVI